MMTFYSAAGIYRIANDGSVKIPYIQSMGRLYPITIPEFVAWSTLLWEVLSYDELRQSYEKRMTDAGAKAPNLDDVMKRLESRRLVVKGIGYTGADALYSMMSKAIMLPAVESESQKVARGLRLLVRGKVDFSGFCRMMHKDHMSEDEQQVMNLLRQKPLNLQELISCINRHVESFSTGQREVDILYPREARSREELEKELYPSPEAKRILEAVANLYLRRHILLEQPDYQTK